MKRAVKHFEHRILRRCVASWIFDNTRSRREKEEMAEAAARKAKINEVM
jgi:hypothetical protein